MLKKIKTSMNAEEIILTNVKALCLFIEQYFSSGGSDNDNIVTKELKRYVELWQETWPRIENWLIESTEAILFDKNESIKNLMSKILPPTTAEKYYEGIKYYLNNSFIIHENFWDQFFENLFKAKSKLLEKNDQ